MLIRTPQDIGALIRDRRKRRQLDQAGLAEMIGVNRRWVVEVEAGKPRAEVGLVLKALQALDVTLVIDNGSRSAKEDSDALDPIDIDAIVADARRPAP
ncbi:helix-turn-helix domain-containing protein [Leptolyngbya sp. 15MV]|nr:helix-turn-helix domain-containing protein [Leptolyngbya sp. 15MV]